MRLTTRELGYQPLVIRANEPTWRAIYDKLAVYEDAEEQGRLLILPCKIGRTVYVIKNVVSRGYPDPVITKQIFEEHYNYEHLDFPDAVYLSYEEAEAAMNGWQKIYDELVKRLRDISRSDSNIKSNYIGLAMLQAVDAIENLCEMVSTAHNELANVIQSYEESKPRWIPVTERLPEAERKSYWVCTDNGYQCQCRWTNNRFGIRESDKWGWSIFDIPQYQKVVAWMLLPRPYEPPKEV